MSPLFFRWLHQLEVKAKRNDERLQRLREAQERAELEEEESENLVYHSASGLVE
jgi:hypothetical protein